MKAALRPCEVPHLTNLATPRVIEFERRTWQLSQNPDAYHVGRHWWLDAPCCDRWVLTCRPETVKVAQFGGPWNGSPWWVRRSQECGAA
ncbi:hypothetical protein [uncultured Deinococcus sp.]|uniref:hypothetical protein n=1 Tax=uncultured Deinococcus sp. TaxID=158789 RepID=UPI0025F5EEB4|nr:hypothetical protein [uncultured Deinococcus sp.]